MPSRYIVPGVGKGGDKGGREKSQEPLQQNRPDERRSKRVLIVGILMTAACLALYLYASGLFESIDNFVYDRFMRFAAVAPKTGRVALVDLDEASLQAYGQWPWPRYLVAELVQKVLDDGASVVALDIIFAETDAQSPLEIKRTLDSRFGLDVRISGVPDRLLDYDALLSDTLRRAGDRTILGCFAFPSETPVSVVAEDPAYRGYFHFRSAGKDGNAGQFLPQAEKMGMSVPVLSRAAGNNAFVNYLPDDDNVVRRVPLAIACGPYRIYPALALESIRAAEDGQVGMEFDSEGVKRIRLGKTVIPTDLTGAMLVRFRTPSGGTEGKGLSAFPSYSAKTVLAGEVAGGAFSNKIVCIGTSAAGLKDMRATPLGKDMAGVEVHATMIDNIVAGDVLARLQFMPLIDVLTIVLVGILLTVLAYKGRPVVSFASTVAVVIVATGVSYFLFARSNLVIIPVWLLSSVIIIYPVLTTVKYLEEHLQKRQVRKMFGTMVSPAVLRYLESNPGSFSLTGRRTEATMFFSDVAGFTAMSEELEPDRLTELLKRYFSPMAKIIMESDGYVDKYEGDLIMAVWGVPYVTEDHATRACLAALEQKEVLEKIRPVLMREFKYDIRVKMAINTGTVIAGNVGSDSRFQYTVIGDPVNLARRLEPANRDYGTGIIIGSATFDGAKDSIEARLLDRILVRGKSKEVYIYELLGRKGRIAPDKRHAADLYEAALNLYWARQWTEAAVRLEEALRIDPEDGASVRLHRLVLGCKASPPGPEWSGLMPDKQIV